jgi:hypothetical protein
LKAEINNKIRTEIIRMQRRIGEAVARTIKAGEIVTVKFNFDNKLYLSGLSKCFH